MKCPPLTVLAWWLWAAGICVSIGLILYGSGVWAQPEPQPVPTSAPAPNVIEIDIRCHAGVCVVPETQLMLILRARSCGVPT